MPEAKAQALQAPLSAINAKAAATLQALEGLIVNRALSREEQKWFAKPSLRL
jgi:hypothetical protein